MDSRCEIVVVYLPAERTGGIELHSPLLSDFDACRGDEFDTSRFLFIFRADFKNVQEQCPIPGAGVCHFDTPGADWGFQPTFGDMVVLGSRLKWMPPGFLA